MMLDKSFAGTSMPLISAAAVIAHRHYQQQFDFVQL